MVRVRAYRRPSVQEMAAIRKLDPGRDISSVDTVSAAGVERAMQWSKRADEVVRKIRNLGAELYFDPLAEDTIYMSVPDSSKGEVLEAIMLFGMRPDEFHKVNFLDMGAVDKTVYRLWWD